MIIRLDLEETEFETILDALKTLQTEVETICIQQGWKNLDEYEQVNGCELEAKSLYRKLNSIKLQKKEA